MQINNTTIEVVEGSVLKQEVEAIVNAANTGMQGGGGIDGAIHKAAGSGLMAELKKVAPHGAKTGTAVITTGHKLKQPWIIHTPGPHWNQGKSGEAKKLALCYTSCLTRAEEKGLASIGFCSISTGIYHYPLTEAAPVALNAVREYLEAHPQTSLRRVVFAMYGPDEFAAYTDALKSFS